MEIKRKKITQEEIFKCEQKFAQSIADVCQYKNEAFHAIGYELELEFGQKENEQQSRFEILSDDENKKFEPGYVSRAMITVKRKQTEEEKAEALRLQSENQTLVGAAEDPSEAEQSQNGEMPVSGEDEDKRSVAFTRVMLVRVYKSFWTEWVNLVDDLDQLQADLDEFFEVFANKQAEVN